MRARTSYQPKPHQPTTYQTNAKTATSAIPMSSSHRRLCGLWWGSWCRIYAATRLRTVLASAALAGLLWRSVRLT